MLIEYKIKFEKNGLTITQRMEPDASATASASPVVQGNQLPPAFPSNQGLKLNQPAPAGGPGDQPKSEGTGGPGDQPKSEGTGGPGGFGSAPIIFIGPIILGGPYSGHEKKD